MLKRNKFSFIHSFIQSVPGTSFYWNSFLRTKLSINIDQNISAGVCINFTDVDAIFRLTQKTPFVFKKPTETGKFNEINI